MPQKVIEKIILENYPSGFLQQFGKELDKIVGLGKPAVKNQGHYITAISIPIRTKNKTFGTYTITKDRQHIISVTYDGSHPFAPQYGLKRIGLSYGMADDRCPGDYHLIRKDGWKEIVFPGIGQYEDAHLNIAEIY